MPEYSRKLYICRKKETSPLKKLCVIVCKIIQIFVASFLLLDVINEWPQKWITVFIVKKLNLIYFTWFVYTFVNYKYNVLLKRDDICLMPLSTFVTLSMKEKTWERRCHNVRNWCRYGSYIWPCHSVATASTTTLWQHCCSVAVPAGKRRLSDKRRATLL